jgi:hypothetical protein
MSQFCLERRRATAGEHREECKDEEGAEGRSACDARSAEEVRRGVEGSKGLKQDRERNDLAKVLERLQQASQVRRQLTLPQRANAEART